MELLASKNLSFSYPAASRPVLRELSFSVKRGELLTLCGATGSGKSTLLRLLKKELAPLGRREGQILFEGAPLEDLPQKESAERIGFVCQHPEEQIVTDKVWHELAFGLENLGYSRQFIHRRVCEIADFFGISHWFDASVNELSGGQKQLLNLASAMATNPQLLLLDEPTSQLDPIAAEEFVSHLVKINRELSTAVIVAEHRLEQLFPVSHRVLLLEEGSLLFDGSPQESVSRFRGTRSAPLLPAASRLFLSLNGKGKAPLTVREGREYVSSNFSNTVRSLPPSAVPTGGVCALEMKNVRFSYEKKGPDVLQGLDLKVFCGESFCILGANGSGKSTALSVAAGILRPWEGKVKLFGKPLKAYGGGELYRENLALLCQDVKNTFLCSTVEEELRDCKEGEALLGVDLSPLYSSHPYDLSGGQQQLLALCKALAARPRLLLLDEPTKGLDEEKKEQLLCCIRSLKQKGITVVTVTHDVEFAARCADRCALLFQGKSVCCEEKRSFFSNNRFYTTCANRMTRGHFDGVLTVEEAAQLCRRNGEKP